jgi:hypothetical protein
MISRKCTPIWDGCGGGEAGKRLPELPKLAIAEIGNLLRERGKQIDPNKKPGRFLSPAQLQIATYHWLLIVIAVIMWR